MTSRRKGYVLHMWTGFFPLNGWGVPRLFTTIERALAHVSRCLKWGRAAVNVHACTVRHYGIGHRPDYIVGQVVANGTEAK